MFLTMYSFSVSHILTYVMCDPRK